jgi:hypothetical protein
MELYPYQYGGSYAIPPDLLFYKANLRRQKGYGLGGIFGTIAKYVLPFAKDYLLPHAKRAVRDIAVDVVDNKVPFKESLRRRGIGALKSMGKSIITGQKGSGYRKRNYRKGVKKATKRKPKKTGFKKQLGWGRKKTNKKNTKKKSKPQVRRKKKVTIRSIFDK